MTEHKRVSFGTILEYSDDLHLESSDDEPDLIYKWPTETIRECVYGIRCLISYVEQNSIKGRPLSLSERIDIMSTMKPIVHKLAEHPDIVNLVTNVRGNLTDLYLPINQLLADFVNTLIEFFKETKTIIYINEGYIENVVDHSTNLHLMIDTPLHVIREYNFEQCLSIHTKPDGLTATHQVKHIYSNLI